jgi:RHS repeat-associated protein
MIALNIIICIFLAVFPFSVHAIEYLHQNHQGSTIAVSNEEGEVVEEIDYEPFGTPVNQTDLSYTYTDQESDATSLMYYGARYQDPNIEQFTQSDQIDTFALTSDPQSLNPYSYTRNNPVNRVDPTGNSDWRYADAPVAKWFVKALDAVVGVFGYEKPATNNIPEERVQLTSAYHPGMVNSIDEAQHPEEFWEFMENVSSSVGISPSNAQQRSGDIVLLSFFDDPLVSLASQSFISSITVKEGALLLRGKECSWRVMCDVSQSASYPFSMRFDVRALVNKKDVGSYHIVQIHPVTQKAIQVSNPLFANKTIFSDIGELTVRAPYQRANIRLSYEIINVVDLVVKSQRNSAFIIDDVSLHGLNFLEKSGARFGLTSGKIKIRDYTRDVFYKIYE